MRMLNLPLLLCGIGWHRWSMWSFSARVKSRQCFRCATLQTRDRGK